MICMDLAENLPSGKHTKNYGKSPWCMGKVTISMAMFNSELLNYQRVSCKLLGPEEDGRKLWERQLAAASAASTELNECCHGLPRGPLRKTIHQQHQHPLRTLNADEHWWVRLPSPRNSTTRVKPLLTTLATDLWIEILSGSEESDVVFT